MNTTKNNRKTDPAGTSAAPGSPTGRTSSDPRAAAEVSDEVLLARCRAGQMAAFGTLVERYQHRLYNAVLRMVGNTDDAQEITQDAFVRALQGLRQFRGRSGFYTWLFRIGMNLSINLRRRRHRVPVVSFSSDNNPAGTQADGLANLAGPAEASPVHRAEVHEAHRRALAALAELEPAMRAVVILRDIEDLDYAQIGRILDIPVGTVKSRLSRARMALRDKLRPQHP